MLSRGSICISQLSVGPWAAAKKTVSVAVPPAPVRFPSQRPLSQCVASVHFRFFSNSLIPVIVPFLQAPAANLTE